MNRRNFLTSLLGATGGMSLDPERLLWRPGAKLISIPLPQRITTAQDIIDSAIRYLGILPYGEIASQSMRDHAFVELSLMTGRWQDPTAFQLARCLAPQYGISSFHN